MVCLCLVEVAEVEVNGYRVGMVNNRCFFCLFFKQSYACFCLKNKQKVRVRLMKNSLFVKARPGVRWRH